MDFAMTHAESIRTDHRKLFVISDVHIGDGSCKDNLMKHDKGGLLLRFLDEVERQNGALMICGDFLELWAYPWVAIVHRWHKLLDRLADMDVIYVTGNHDELHNPSFSDCRSAHRFFNAIRHPFVKTIGGRRFKFMHGHEVDPLISHRFTAAAPVLRFLAGTLEFKSDTCLITSDAVSDFLMEAGEQWLRIWHTLTRQVNRAYLQLGLSDSMTRLKTPLRTRNMLARFYDQQLSGDYDITITGHTHNAGFYGTWYYNCGCWTRQTPNYMVIDPDGRVEIRNWTAEGSVLNTASVA
jgi:UDP-2,3-diacylglucosamine pyrophosphatase LpxH